MIRNYRQIAKAGSRVAFIGVGKTQGGKNQLGDPRLYINEFPEVRIKPNYKYSPELPSISFTIEKD